MVDPVVDVRPLSREAPPMESQTSSSTVSSGMSRTSSAHSTNSVEAVPIRTPPARLTLSTPMSRAGSGSTGTGSVSGYFTPYRRQNTAPGSGAGTPIDLSLLGLGHPGSGLPTVASQGDMEHLHHLAERPSLSEGRNLSDVPATMAAQDANGDKGTIVLRKTTADFAFKEVLGEGSYSTVSLVTDKAPPHRSYALKILDKEHIKRERKTKYVLIERDTLKILDGHPGIVRLYWTFQDARSLYFVLELAENGELQSWLRRYGSFSLACARYYIAQILSAVRHMHTKGVIHRDLKPENVLLDTQMRVKITDFGTAKVLGQDEKEEDPSAQDGQKKRRRSFVGTPEYVSPEILSEGKESSRMSDYWGVGCILFQLLAGRPPFVAPTEYLMFQKITKLDYDFPAGFDGTAMDLVRKLLVLDPVARLGSPETGGIEAIMAHPFFTLCDPPVDWDAVWSVEPPTLATGLMQPKPQGRLVLDEADEAVFESSEEDDEAESSRQDLPDQRGEGASAAIASSSVGSKWDAVLSPEETILFFSPVVDKTSFLPLMTSKKRILMLTDAGRLLSIKDAGKSAVVKDELRFGEGDKDQVRAVAAESGKVFTVRTDQKTYRFEESSGAASRWVAEITDILSQRPP